MFMDRGVRVRSARELTNYMGMGFSPDNSETLGGGGEPEAHFMNARKWAGSQGMTAPEPWRGTQQEGMYFEWEYTCYWKQSSRSGSQEWITCPWWRRAEPPLWSYQGSTVKERWVPDKTRQGGRRVPQKDEVVEKSAYCGMESCIHN